MSRPTKEDVRRELKAAIDSVVDFNARTGVLVNRECLIEAVALLSEIDALRAEAKEKAGKEGGK